ncbi:MAG: HNH endonuclease [Syntrophaceae bacterium]|nr:HNH endonuclease [Syntrophaceae bacterium]
MTDNAHPKQKAVRLKGTAYKKLQISVLKRDHFFCHGWIEFDNKSFRCGVPVDGPPHHIIFRSQGGPDTMENMITLCKKCHAKAHGITIKEHGPRWSDKSESIF